MSHTWNDGYVSEIAYTYGVYRELAPGLLAFAALNRNVLAPDVAAPLTYCELGCGQGVSTNLLAAANPHIQFHATDFNPAQTNGARRLASQAGLTNITFHNDSFEEFAARDDLPRFDIITLHGIYSWISPQNRAHIVEFIRRRLNVGGLVYISYNTLPGWAAIMPLRRLLVDRAATGDGSILTRVDRALASAESLAAVNARYFAVNSTVKPRLDQIKGQPRSYVAHEYFNRDWTPFYHADVASDLAAAKLNYIASANLLDHFDPINLTSDQQKLLAETTDPSMRETTRDYIVNQQFRRDIFTKGGATLSPLEHRERWLSARFALCCMPEDVPVKVTGAMGEASLQTETYRPVVDALGAGPASVAELLQRPELAALGFGRVQQVLQVLVGMGNVNPCLPAAIAMQGQASTRAFNRAVVEQARYSGDLGYLASPVLGSAINIDRIHQLFLLARLLDNAEPVRFALAALTSNNQRLTVNGQILATEEENLAELGRRFQGWTTKVVPVLTNLGII